MNRIWDDHGYNSAISWVRANFPVAAEAMIDRRRQMERDWLNGLKEA